MVGFIESIRLDVIYLLTGIVIISIIWFRNNMGLDISS
jgi:hypothetical protein